MGTTPILALPYPEASDAADVPTDMLELATALDGLVHKTTYGTTPPASPADGDIWMFPADTTNGVIWQLRYRSASAAPYKWEFVGGAPLITPVVLGPDSTASTSYVDLTGGPQLTLPRAGDYMVSFGFMAWISTTAGVAAMTVKRGAAAASDNDNAEFVSSPVGNEATLSRTFRADGAAASDIYKMQARVGAGTGNFMRRWMTTTPVRVS